MEKEFNFFWKTGYIGPTGMLVYGTLINVGSRSFEFMEKLYGSWN